MRIELMQLSLTKEGALGKEQIEKLSPVQKRLRGNAEPWEDQYWLTAIQPAEYYAVHDALWSEACAVEPALPGESGMLCIGCLEARLGRELCAADFKTRNPRSKSSKRFLDRLRRHQDRSLVMRLLVVPA